MHASFQNGNRGPVKFGDLLTPRLASSGNEIGPFRAIEESIVAQLTPKELRGDIYAWYSLLGLTGAAVGLISCGWIVHYSMEKLAWTDVQSYRLIFYVYSIIGLAKLLLSVMLSPTVEAEGKKAIRTPPSGTNGETTPLLQNPDAPIPADQPRERSGIRGLLPEISPQSVFVVVNLTLLFGLDAFSSGLAPL
jgi:MFS family permease